MFSLRYQRFCRYRVQYVIPGAAGRTSHVPAPPTCPASWSSTRLAALDGLYSCVTVLKSWRPFLLEFNCLLLCSGRVQWPCPVRTAGQARLISSYRNTNDLLMVHMISVKYHTFSLSLVFCLDSPTRLLVTYSSVFACPGAGPSGSAATDWHCGATAAWCLHTDDLAS